MIRNLSRLAALALAVGGLAGAAAAQAQDHPRVSGGGENFAIDYGPNPTNNVLGGGRTVVSGGGENLVIRYLDPHVVQRPPSGRILTVLGGNENWRIIWVEPGRPVL